MENKNQKVIKIFNQNGKSMLSAAKNVKELIESASRNAEFKNGVDRFLLLDNYDGIANRGDTLNDEIFLKLINICDDFELDFVALEENKDIAPHVLRYFKIPNYFELADLIEELNEAEKIDLCFLVDCTPSMDIQKCLPILKFIVTKSRNDLMDRFPFLQFRVLFVGYRDFEDGLNQFVIKEFSSDIDKFLSFFEKLMPMGTGDSLTEDVLGGLNEVINLDWKNKTRFLIHICDAPPHTFGATNSLDKYSNGHPRQLNLETIFKKLVMELNVHYYFFKINDTTDEMINNFNEILNGLQLRPIIEYKLPSADDLIETFLSSISLTIFNSQRRTMFEAAYKTPKVPKNLIVNKSATHHGNSLKEYNAIRYNFRFKGDLGTFNDLMRKYKLKLSGASMQTTQNLLDYIDTKDEAINIKINLKPFAQGNFRYAYAAIVNDHDKCVVKNSLYENDDTNLHTFNHALITTQLVARYLAEQFLEKMENERLQGNKRLSFNKAELVYINETGKYYVIEKYIPDKFLKWNNNVGLVNEDIYSNTLDAYSHWTYVATNNYLVVSDLQGFRLFDNEKQQEKYILTDPAISCVDRQFTSTDLGEIGIIKFFEKHVCNKFCQKLKLLQPDFQTKKEIRVMKKRSTDIRDDFLEDNGSDRNSSSEEN